MTTREINDAADNLPPAEIERLLADYPREGERSFDMPTLEFHAWLVVTGKMRDDGDHEWPVVETRPLSRGGPDYSGRSS